MCVNSGCGDSKVILRACWDVLFALSPSPADDHNFFPTFSVRTNLFLELALKFYKEKEVRMSEVFLLAFPINDEMNSSCS